MQKDHEDGTSSGLIFVDLVLSRCTVCTMNECGKATFL